MDSAPGQKLYTIGQIMRSTEPYRVVPHMKALDKCFPDDTMTSFDDVMMKSLIFP
jgi:hypothetical protein